MRIISWNINGVRKHFEALQELVQRFSPDVICLQKVRTCQGTPVLPIEGYHFIDDPVVRYQFGGVAAYCKDKAHLTECPEPLARVGHFQSLAIDGCNAIFFNVYAPYSNIILDSFVEYRKNWDKLLHAFTGTITTPIIMCGDFNVIREAKDTWNNRLTPKVPCFFDWERKDFRTLMETYDLVDVFRELHPEEPLFTYFDPRDRNRKHGYRLDYFLISRSLLPMVRKCAILTDIKASQSYPLLLDIDLPIEHQSDPVKEASKSEPVFSYAQPRPMKVVSWNACCKFREKYKEIAKLDADIYVIQECENPATCKDEEYREFVKNHIWKGDLNYKGLMVFTTKPDVKLELLDWPGWERKHFIPVRVNDHFTLVGSWACIPYCVELHDWVTDTLREIAEDTVIIGDLNSNVKLDPSFMKNGKSFRSVLELLEPLGLKDMWTHHHNEEAGKESVPTFYLYRHLDKPDHLDHCIASPNVVKSIKIHARWEWLQLSDHLPIEIETY